MNGVEIPEYFLCPISLQIMQDPVTTVTGITYERAAIERWLTMAVAGICPVTNQPLSPESLLTPNHMLRRLIRAWCTVNGVDRAPSPQAPITKSHVNKLVRALKSTEHPEFFASLGKLEAIAMSSSSANRKCLVDLGVANDMVDLLVRLCVEEKTLVGVRETLRILHRVLAGSTIPARPEVVDSVTWILTITDDVVIKTHAVIVMRKVSEVSSSILERLETSFFKAIVGTITNPFSNKATSSALRLLIRAAQCTRNRMKMITETDLIHALIELELDLPESDKKTTELTMRLLGQLCGCADGRERLVGHGAGLAVVTKRLLKVSPIVDEAVVGILAAIARFSGTAEVVGEMMKVGAVAKLCMVLQANCEKSLKLKARDVLRLHYGIWNRKDCVQMYLVSGFPTLEF